jgi:NitT/TauT family transport system substrate-binding protein
MRVCLAATLAAGIALSSAARAAEPVILHLDFLVNGYHAPFYVAEQKGWYRDAGLDVTIRPGRGTADSIKNVGSGSAQFGFPDFGATAKAVAEGIPITAVASYLQNVPGGIVSFASKPVREPKDLSGKSLAVASFGATVILLPAFLKRNHVDPGTVQRIEYNMGAMVPSFLTGKVDATIGFYFGEYLAAATETKGTGREVLFMRYSDFGIQAYGNGLVVNNDFMRAKPDAVRAFVQATMKGIRYTVDHVDEAADAAAKNTETPRDMLRAQLTLALEFINNDDAKRSGFGIMTKAKWDDTQNIGVEFGGQKGLVPDAQLWTNKFVEQ